MRQWRQYLYYRTSCVRTTWLSRVSLGVLFLAVAVTAQDFWVRTIADSLTCSATGAASDAILIENFDPDYLLFEHAGRLQMAGLAPRIFIPVKAFPDGWLLNLVTNDMVAVMARHARLASWELIPIQEVEPISLNAARQIARHLTREGVTSLTVVAPGFRSRRSALVYSSVLGRAGIRVHCVPLLPRGMERWTAT